MTRRSKSAALASTPLRRPYAVPAVEQSGSFERVVLGCTHTTAEAQFDDCELPIDHCSTACGGSPES